MRINPWQRLGIALVILSLTLAACAAPAPGAPAAPAEAEKSPAAPSTGPAEVELTVWAQANEVERWRVDGPVKAAELVTDYKLKVVGVRDDAGWADYKKKFTLAADAGEAPDIVLSGHEDVPVWANAGYIVEFTDCKARYPEFEDVIESLWDSGMWQGKL